MPRGGKRARSGRKAIPDPRTPYEIRLSRAERAEIDAALDPGETFSEFMRQAGLAEARRRAGEDAEGALTAARRRTRRAAVSGEE